MKRRTSTTAIEGASNRFGEPGVIQKVRGRADQVRRCRARTLDAQGRWTRKDPIGFRGGSTMLYGYAFQDPINFADPTGLDVGDWWDLPANYRRAEEIGIEELDRAARAGAQDGTGAHNNLNDSLRHAEWNRRMAEELGTGCAVLFSYGYEITHPGPIGEMLADLNNDCVGRGAAKTGLPYNPNDFVQPGDEDFHGPYGPYGPETPPPPGGDDAEGAKEDGADG